MVRLILNIVLFIILAVFVVINLPYKTSVNLFSWVIEEVSVVAVVLMSFVLGIIYSFVTYLITFFVKQKKQRLKRTGELNKEKEKQLGAREKTLEATMSEASPPAAAQAPEPPPESKRKKKGKISR